MSIADIAFIGVPTLGLVLMFLVDWRAALIAVAVTAGVLGALFCFGT